MENQKLDDYFGYTEAGSSLEGELRAGMTTFLTMAYILLVNPAMLSISGIPFDDALFATAIGLFAAIPAVVAYNRYSAVLDDVTSSYITFTDEFSSILHRQIHST